MVDSETEREEKMTLTSLVSSVRIFCGQLTNGVIVFLSTTMALRNSAGLQSLSGVFENKEFLVPDLDHRLLPLDRVLYGNPNHR